MSTPRKKSAKKTAAKEAPVEKSKGYYSNEDLSKALDAYLRSKKDKHYYDTPGLTALQESVQYLLKYCISNSVQDIYHKTDGEPDPKFLEFLKAAE